MRRRILESAILEALWLGPLFGAPSALAFVVHRGGPAVPWLWVAIAVLIGARRGLDQSSAPLLAVAGLAEAWALWASGVSMRDPSTLPLSATLLTTGIAWIFVPALMRTLEPRDTLESHFPRTVLADSATILVCVSLAVVLELHAALGFTAALLVALLGQRSSALRIRAGLAIVGGVLLHTWLGLDPAIALASVSPAAAAVDLVRGGALNTAALFVGAIVLARADSRDH